MPGRRWAASSRRRRERARERSHSSGHARSREPVIPTGQQRLWTDRPGYCPVMRAWTDVVIAHRGRIIAVWLVAFVLGGLGAANLGGLLSNRFSVPGADSERGLDLLRDHMGDRSDGAFTLVAAGVDGAAERAAVVAAARRAARAVEGGGKAGPPLDAGGAGRGRGGRPGAGRRGGSRGVAGRARRSTPGTASPTCRSPRRWRTRRRP